MTNQTAILPAVAAIIFNDKGEVLLQRRKDVGKWGLLSGHVEFGESVTEAMLREIKEETDTAATIQRLIGIYSSPASQTYHYVQRTVQYVTAYFEARLLTEISAGFTNDETAELRYFATDQLPAEMAQVNPHWLQDALQVQGTPYLR